MGVNVPRMTTTGEDSTGQHSPSSTGAAGFDAGRVALEAMRRGEDPLETVVGQLVGYASACWEDLSGAGVFESDRAAVALESTVGWLRTHLSSMVAHAPAGSRLVLMVDHDPSADEVEGARRLAGWMQAEPDEVPPVVMLGGVAQVVVVEPRVEVATAAFDGTDGGEPLVKGLDS